MLTDNEIRRITEDSLQFKAFAQTLEEIITTSETPITIGVYGAWGSGKTSLMRMTQDILKDGDKIKTVWFDAWKFDKTYDLRVALIHAILRKMKDDKSISPKLKEEVGKLLKRVNWLGLGKTALSYLSPFAISQEKEPLLKNQEEISGKTLELIGDFEEKFEELTKEYVSDEGRMVVFIDDLDRCISEKTIDILEAIKLFLNVPLSVFVIGADKKRIEEGIIEKYGEKSEGWAGNYLEKIVQIPFTLPPLRKDVITEQFIQGLDISTEIKKYAPILAEVGDNPRTIKRLLNSFEVKRILAEKRELEIEENIMAKLAVIEFRWHDFYTDLIGIYSETETNPARILKEISESNEVEREKKLKEWEILRKHFEDKRLMDFLEEEPPLWDVNLDHYVYLARSTTELKVSALLEEKYLFSWDNVPGTDSEILLRFLRDDLDIGWAENAAIRKSDDGETIRIFKDENSAEIMIEEKKEKATLKISDGGTYDLKVKKEDGKLNIYKEKYLIKYIIKELIPKVAEVFKHAMIKP